MTDEVLDALRANVTRHDAAARTRPLVELGQALADRYWRAGPGTPAGRPFLDEAIPVLDEAYGHFEPGDAMRGQVAGLLGWLLAVRHTAHGSPDRDRETGIFLLDEALTFTQLAPIQRAVAQLFLGQLLIGRVTSGMKDAGFAMAAMTPGPDPATSAGIDRAVECFRQVLDGPVASQEITSVARAMLTLAETLQTMMGGSGGMDLGRMMQAFSAVQNLQRQTPGGPGSVPSFLDADRIAAADPMERPVAVIDGPAEPEPVAAPARPRRTQPKPPPPAAALRAALAEKFGGRPALGALLVDGATLPGIAAVDELVALGGSLAAAPDAVGADHLFFAVGLYLRGRVAGGGWAGGDGADDVRAAGDALIAAADALRAEPADAVTTAFDLATRLDERLPSGQVRARLSDRFGEVTRALRTVGADALLYPGLRLAASSGLFGYVDGTARPLSRVLVVGDGPVPGDATVSYVRSAAQVLALGSRTRRAVTDAAVFVANPRLDRDRATIDALVLRRTFYPRSAGLGNTVENIDGAGTPDEVRVRLGASMLHLGCGVTAAGGLELAGSRVLAPDDIAATSLGTAGGGVALLPPSATGAPSLAEALLTAGYLSVIGFRDPVPDRLASLMYVLLHAELVDRAHDPASAVRSVRQWMADPDRKPPEYLPTECRVAASSPAMAEPANLDALTCHGL